MTKDVLVILADDLTGATDAAVRFAKLGARTDVWLDEPRFAGDAEVAAIDLDTRALAPEVAAERVAALARALPSTVRLMKKIDSTLRGNIAAETAALLEARPGAVAVVVPAHPRKGRVQRAGRLLVDGVPVHETDFGRDLFTPVRASDVRAHLPAGATVLAAPSVLGGRETLARELEAAVRGGARVVAIDAEHEDDLSAIAAIVAEEARYLGIGSAGLFEALAPLVAARSQATAALAAGSGGSSVVHPVLFVIGSLSAMTHLQIACFRSGGGVTETIDPRTILIDEGRSRSAAIRTRIDGALGAGHDVLVALSSDRIDVEAALSMGRLHGFDVPTTSRELRERFVELVAPLVSKAGTVVLSGADVARTFFGAAGIAGVRLTGEAAEDIPLGRGLGRSVLLVTKGGGSGTPETYRDIARSAVSA